MTTELLHATAICVAVDPDGPLAGVLLLGPSGCGKSTLAIGLIESCPWRRSVLAADDAVLLDPRASELYARARGGEPMIEARGFGPVQAPSTREILVRAAFDLQNDAPRLPQPQRRAFAGVELPVWPFRPAPDGPARLRVILRAILSRRAAFAVPEPS